MSMVRALSMCVGSTTRGLCSAHTEEASSTEVLLRSPKIPARIGLNQLGFGRTSVDGRVRSRQGPARPGGLGT